MLEYSMLKSTPPVRTDLFSMARTYMHTILTSTYFFYAPFFYVLFWVNVELVIYVVETYFPSALANTGLVNIFNSVAFLPNLIYIMFIQSIYNGYTDGITFYLSFLQKVERIALTCNENQLKHILAPLHLLIDMGDELRGEQLPISYEALESISTSVANLKLAVRDMGPGESVRYILSYLRHMLDKDDKSLDTVDELVTVQQSLERGMYITDPPFLNNQNTILLFAWYCVWLPYTFRVLAGRGPTILLYPFVAMILWGPAILRLWLGNAWSPTRPFETNNEHESWPDDFKASVTNIVEKRLAISRLSSSDQKTTSKQEMPSVSKPVSIDLPNQVIFPPAASRAQKSTSFA